MKLCAFYISRRFIFFIHFKLLSDSKFLATLGADIIYQKSTGIVFLFNMRMTAGLFSPRFLHLLSDKIFHNLLIINSVLLMFYSFYLILYSIKVMKDNDTSQILKYRENFLLDIFQRFSKHFSYDIIKFHFFQDTH